ncbi:MAG: serine/threonine protein kinase [Candidatus Obscuribacterales bacterium]|nr:serine/threonine protein kinase [Candidatus Obscuribacterales bacterium]
MKPVRVHRDYSPNRTSQDADNRSDATTVAYRQRPGAYLRERIIASSQDRFNFGICIAVTFIVCFLILLKILGPGSAIGQQITPLVAGIGSLLLLAMTLLTQKDEIYLDRLTLLRPSAYLPTMEPKLLWSKIEELSLVNLSKDEKSPRLALRLSESTGEEHDLILSAFDSEGLSVLSGYLRKYCSHARGIAQLADLERFYDFQLNKLPGISYTQLWESSASAQFGLTSFTPLAPGKKILDRYCVIRQIAAGGFSAIYLIADGEGNEFVLKESVIPPNLEPELQAKATQQFEREANLLSRLDHPQIARVFDHFVEEGRNYLRLEFIEGKTVRKLVDEQKGQSEALVLSWLEQLAKILVYLHSLDPPVIHRDLSPDNVLARPDSKVILIDFGAANEFIAAATGTLVGKHAYMAPEQIRGNAEPQSDIYSLGSVGFFALTGRDPEPIRSSSALLSGAPVSDWLDTFIKKATALDKEERFISSADCLAYLTRTRNSA